MNYFTPDNLEQFIHDILQISKLHYPRKFKLESMQGYVSSDGTLSTIDQDNPSLLVTAYINPLTDEGFIAYELVKLLK